MWLDMDDSAVITTLGLVRDNPPTGLCPIKEEPMGEGQSRERNM